MAGKYTEAERASVFIALEANQGNVARSARDTGVPKQTVRDWKRKWQQEGPPDFDETVFETVASSFIEQAERVRDKILLKFEEAVDKGELKPDKMPIAIGILDDKVRLHKGLATSRSESTLALPSPEEVREMFSGLIRGAIEAATNREAEIIDLDEQSFAEVKELNPGKED